MIYDFSSLRQAVSPLQSHTDYPATPTAKGRVDLPSKLVCILCLLITSRAKKFLTMRYYTSLEVGKQVAEKKFDFRLQGVTDQGLQFLNKISLELVNEMYRKHIVPLFSVESDVFIACPLEEADDIESGLKESGYVVETHSFGEEEEHDEDESEPEDS